MNADSGLQIADNLAFPPDAITQSFALLAVRRAGKALALDTKVPTPAGWSTMGDIKQGDIVFDERGRQCKVTDAWPTLYGRPCYEVQFSDGTVITADAEHQWFADTKRSRRKYENEWFNNVPADIYTTEQMAASLKDASGRESNYSVRVAALLVTEDAELLVPPYTLGAWLGDGASATGSITSADSEIIAEIDSEGETTWAIPSTVKANHASYRVKGLQPRLGRIGVLGNKHIPSLYLRASESQRRALLAGLLDTDGYCSKRGAAEYCSTRQQLAYDVFHLVASLGYKPSMRSKVARLYGKPCGTVWTVGFTPSDKVFRLPRKAARQVAGRHFWSEHRYVTAIRQVVSVPVRCIAVDSPSHLYLVTDACIPTHNSNAAAVMAEEMYKAGLPWVAIDPKGDWWGLRSSRDGKSDGLPIPIFGGLHGDMPLVPEAGHLIADLIADQNLTCVLDVSEFPSKAAQMRFLADLGERLFRLHGKHPQPRHLFLEEADDFCMTPDTEILTESGWATWDQVRIGTMAVAFDPATTSYRYEPVQRVILREHDGEMVHLKTKALDCLVTPEHRVVLQRFQHDPGRFRWYDWAFCEAQDVPGNVRIPTGGAPEGPGIADLDEETLRILGWVVTDGFFHDRRKSDVIGLEQSTATRKRGVMIAEEMATVLAGRGGTSKSIRQPRSTLAPQGPVNGAAAYCWFFGRALSAELLKWLGDDLHRLPRRLLEECSRSQLEALYQGLMEGDGTASGTSHWVRFYPGRNEALADDFQELATRLGISSSKLFVTQIGQWHVTINARAHHFLKRRPERTTYKGMVWDITVPSGAFVARRNGRVFVTGNCPQRVMREQARCVGAWTKLVKQGGSRGLGVTLISQRSAVVNKDALTQTETLIALRTTSPQDRKAISEWVSYHDVARELVDSLPGLEDGEAWVCSPHWLGRHGQPAIQRIRFRQRSTFDSGATPTMRSSKAPVASLADIDLGALSERMAAVTEKAEQDDPKALRRRIAELERARKAAPAKADDSRLAAENQELRAQLAEAKARPAERIEIPVLAPGDVAAIEQVIAAIRDLTPGLEAEAARLESAVSRASVPKPPPPVRVQPARVRTAPSASPPAPAEPDGDPAPLTLGKAQRTILTVLAQFPEGRTRRQVAMLAGYSGKGGGFNNALSSLRSAGLIERGEPIRATGAGVAAIGSDWEPLPTGAALAEHWIGQLGKAEGLILRALLDAYPLPLTKEDLAEQTGYAANGGGFNNALSRLRTLELIDGRGEMRADGTLAEEAMRDA